MAEGWKKRMYESLAEMLREEYNLDAVDVTEFEDYTYTDGYCETCYYESTKCKITYVDSQGVTQTYDYWGSFAELVGSL
jgi:hypothetical protein